MGDPTKTALQQSSEKIDWMEAVQTVLRNPIIPIADNLPQAPVLHTARSMDGACGASIIKSGFVRPIFMVRLLSTCRYRTKFSSYSVGKLPTWTHVAPKIIII